MAKSILLDKSFSFSLLIIRLYKYLSTEKREYVLSKQVLRSGTAIGALIREAEHAQSDADFLNKMNVSLKEANETAYWLELLFDGGFIDKKSFDSVYPKAVELIKMLASTVKTMKNKLRK